EADVKHADKGKVQPAARDPRAAIALRKAAKDSYSNWNAERDGCDSSGGNDHKRGLARRVGPKTPATSKCRECTKRKKRDSKYAKKAKSVYGCGNQQVRRTFHCNITPELSRAAK